MYLRVLTSFMPCPLHLVFWGCRVRIHHNLKASRLSSVRFLLLPGCRSKGQLQGVVVHLGGRGKKAGAHLAKRDGSYSVPDCFGPSRLFNPAPLLILVLTRAYSLTICFAGRLSPSPPCGRDRNFLAVCSESARRVCKSFHQVLEGKCSTLSYTILGAGHQLIIQLSLDFSPSPTLRSVENAAINFSRSLHCAFYRVHRATCLA